MYKRQEQVGVLGGKRSLYRTTDGGQTWTSVGREALSGASVIAIEYIGGNTFYALCSSKLLKSSDDGQTWTAVDITPLTELALSATGMDFYNEENGIITTNGYVAIYTNDGGESWYVEHYDMDTVFYDAAAVDTGMFYLCGQDGMIIKRTSADTTLPILDTI